MLNTYAVSHCTPYLEYDVRIPRIRVYKQLKTNIMQTSFGTYYVQKNAEGKKYPARFTAEHEGKVVRVLLNDAQFAAHPNTITGIITFAEEVNEQGAFGFRMISTDNERVYQLQLAQANKQTLKNAAPVGVINEI